MLDDPTHLPIAPHAEASSRQALDAIPAAVLGWLRAAEALRRAGADAIETIRAAQAHYGPETLRSLTTAATLAKLGAVDFIVESEAVRSSNLIRGPEGNPQAGLRTAYLRTGGTPAFLDTQSLAGVAAAALSCPCGLCPFCTERKAAAAAGQDPAARISKMLADTRSMLTVPPSPRIVLATH